MRLQILHRYVFNPNRLLRFGRDFCFMLSGFSLDFCRYGGLFKEKVHKNTPVETKRRAGSINAQN